MLLLSSSSSSSSSWSFWSKFGSGGSAGSPLLDGGKPGMLLSSLSSSSSSAAAPLCKLNFFNLSNASCILRSLIFGAVLNNFNWSAVLIFNWL